MPVIDKPQEEALQADKNEDSNSPSQQQEERPPLPEFTLRNVINDIKYGIKQLIFNPEFNKVVIPILLVLESIAVKVIRGVVSCEYI